MLDLARINRIATQFDSERARHRGLRKARVGTCVLARVGAAGAERRAASSESQRRSGSEEKCSDSRGDEIDGIVKPRRRAPEVEVTIVAVANHRVERVDRLVSQCKDRAANEKKAER